MFPGGMNPKQMQGMLKQFGIKSEEIDAKKVIIDLGEKNLVIENPQITIMNVQGKKIYTIQGEEKLEEKGYSEEDLNMVAEQAKVSKEKALAALKKNKGDIAEAIMELKQDDT